MAAPDASVRNVQWPCERLPQWIFGPSIEIISVKTVVRRVSLLLDPSLRAVLNFVTFFNELPSPVLTARF